VGVLVELVLGLLVNIPGAVGLVARVRGPGRRHVGDAGPLEWLASALLLAATAPLVHVTWRITELALRFLDDDLMWFLGLILFLPLALFAVVTCATAVAAAGVAAHGLLTDAERGRAVVLAAAGSGVAVGLVLAGSGLVRHGLVTAGLAFLAAGCAASERANA
jgi:hypothetical protein